MSGQKETLVLLHGIMKGPLDMVPAKYYFSKHGYDVHNIDYDYRADGVDIVTANVWKTIQERGLDRKSVRMHFVAHSMGGVVVDRLINTYQPVNQGRVVMWGTPLQGCAHADSLDRYMGRLFRAILGQAGLDLRVAAEDPLRHKPMAYEAGMIAGLWSWNIFGPIFLKNAGPNDGIVPLSSTIRPGQKAHMAINRSHPGLLFSPRALRETLHFLQNGRFTV